MQKFELSEKMLENVTGGINKKSALKIGSATGTMAIISVAAGICGAIYMSKKKKKQEHILETREFVPQKPFSIEEF